MSTIWSPTTGGFYSLASKDVYVKAGTWPADGIEITEEERDALLAAEKAGSVIQLGANNQPEAVQKTLTPDQVRAQYEASAQDLLDSTARAWGYDSVISAASYASSGVAQYKADAQALITWRDSLWQKAFSVESDVKAGTIPMPATAADFLAMLPAAPTRPVA